MGRWSLSTFDVPEFQAFQSISLLLSPFQTIKEVDLLSLSSLEYIDLSRNHIGEVMPGTFLGMNNLKGLDFSVNTVLKASILILNLKIFASSMKFILCEPLEIILWTTSSGS